MVAVRILHCHSLVFARSWKKRIYASQNMPLASILLFVSELYITDFFTTTTVATRSSIFRITKVLKISSLSSRLFIITNICVATLFDHNHCRNLNIRVEIYIKRRRTKLLHLHE